MQFFQTINVNFSTSDLSWVAKIVQWLIGITSSVAFGVILFTLVLKLITSPFDFFSRYSMRKNSVIMEQMRPELEKLQKQYADDKTLYNQKMMAIYKKNGYSMWGSCLPTILTLVIFIVAINGFSSYSNYQNREYFYEMSKSYNSVCYDGFNYDGGYIIKNKDGSYKIKTDKQAEL
ncbi:MAG: YidC/Oxa1 family membrane protein insertase, partial [Clostridia bacterium]|nr:YidC/Oxa1 family membrane protein insertase [Clostridia bacterium]